MNDAKNMSLKKPKNTIVSNETHKENKHLNKKEEQINIKPLQIKISNQYEKNANPFFIHNKNHIESIDIINNNKNYKNIILNNMLTPNKKLFIKEKISSRNKNIKSERNVLFDNGHGTKNFRTLGQTKQKSLNKNSGLKLLLNNQEQDNNNDLEMKYKLILFEKNNLINKLKSEVEYYKNYYHNINMNMNIILPNNNNTIEANRANAISLGLNDKKNSDGGENFRNRIKNIFSIPKKEAKLDNNHILQHNINEYNTLKTFVNSDNINYNNVETTKDLVPQIKANNFNTIENNNTNINKYNNHLLLSNDSLKNDLIINKNNTENSDTKTLNNIFYRSNSNTIPHKGRKLKLGFQQSELALEMNNNYNSIEANRNYMKNKKHIIYSLNYLSSKNGSDNEFDNNKRTIDDNSINKIDKSNNNNYYNNISSSPSSQYRDIRNKNIIDNNSKNSIVKNETFEKFNYRDNFENLKKRMNNLVNNLFDLIEIKNKKSQQEIKNDSNKI
jgi:hypothetical protein